MEQAHRGQLQQTSAHTQINPEAVLSKHLPSVFSAFLCICSDTSAFQRWKGKQDTQQDREQGKRRCPG